MHNVGNSSSLARTRDLISMIAQCLREHSANPDIRFLVPARNDAVVAYVITITLRFCSHLPSKTKFCVYLVKPASRFTLQDAILHTARAPSSLAKTRDLMSPQAGCKQVIRT